MAGMQVRAARARRAAPKSKPTRPSSTRRGQELDRKRVPCRVPSAGRAALVPVVVLALFAVLTLGYVERRGSADPDPAPRRGAPATIEVPGETGAEPLDATELALEVDVASAAERAPIDELAPASEARAAGTGAIVVRVESPAGRPYAGAFELEARPLDGGAGPVAATMHACLGDEHVLGGLAAGAYELRAAAPGRASRVGRAAAGTATVPTRLTLVLEPARVVTGFVVDARGLPVAGLDVALVSVQDKRTSRARTAADGRFGFDSVLEGAHSLCFGDATSPLVELLACDVRGHDLELAPVTLPPLHELDCEVRGPDGRTVADASVLGRAPTGGSFAGRTDRAGRIRATLLPRGRYRVFASHPDQGRANQFVDVPLEAGGRLVLDLPGPRARRR